MPSSLTCSEYATAPWEWPELAGDGCSSSRTDFEGDEGSATRESPLPAAIGKYLVVGRFPHSGQAEVFRVVHPQFQQERVLKLAKASVGPDGRSEIVEEGKIMAELEHPHLIRVYDLDFLDDRPYLSNKLQPLGSYSQAVLFPNVGG